MARFSDPLSRVRVASPCSADWDSMIGNDRTRFCSQCELNVFNLSAMTRAEAEHLIANAETRLCVRFYRRRDGSIITQDCPVGLRRLKLRASRIRKAVAAALFGFFAGTGGTVAVHGVENLLTNLPLGRSQMLGTMAEPVRRPPPIDPPVIAVDPPVVGRMVYVGRIPRQRPRRH
jgi:hypothetical protein